MKINDGTGKGFEARVDANNRFHTQTVSEDEALHSAELGDAYNINTGNISFATSGTFLYVKNNEDKDMVVKNIAVGVGSGTTSDMGEITVIRNPSGGDLITDATLPAINVNRNFGSSRTLEDSLVYMGKSNGTITGGDDALLLYQGVNSRLFAGIDLVLQKGSSVAIKYDPKLSSGTVKAYAAIIAFLKDPESKD